MKIEKILGFQIMNHVHDFKIENNIKKFYCLNDFLFRQFEHYLNKNKIKSSIIYCFMKKHGYTWKDENSREICKNKIKISILSTILKIPNVNFSNFVLFFLFFVAITVPSSMFFFEKDLNTVFLLYLLILLFFSYYFAMMKISYFIKENFIRYHFFESLKYNRIFNLLNPYLHYRTIDEIFSFEKKYHVIFIFQEISESFIDKFYYEKVYNNHHDFLYESKVEQCFAVNSETLRKFYFPKNELVKVSDKKCFDIVFSNKNFTNIELEEEKLKKSYFEDFYKKAKEEEKNFWYIYAYVIKFKRNENEILLQILVS